MSNAATAAMPPAPTLPDWVRPAIEKFKRLELEYMASLPLPLKTLLGDGDPASFDSDKHHMRLYGSLAFVLLGVKPCALLAHGVSLPYTQGLVEAALLPVARDFDLQGHGFLVEKIQHRLLTDNPGRLSTMLEFRCGPFVNCRVYLRQPASLSALSDSQRSRASSPVFPLPP